MTRHAISVMFVALTLLTAGGCRKTATWSDNSPHKSGFVTTNGVRLNYLDWGGSGPALILIHGYGDNPHACGLLMQTSAVIKVDSMLKLDFLVQEGQINVDAIVRRAEPGRALALKFTKMRSDDQSRLDALVNRLRQTAA